MHNVQRVEIVVDTVKLNDVMRILAELEVGGATIIRNVQGIGHRGARDADELTDVFSNAYIMVACSPELTQSLAEAIRPVIERFGGLFLVTPAQSLMA